jgi:hypothetical protein
MRMRSAVRGLVIALALARPVAAAPSTGLHLDRADVGDYPLVKLYMTYVEGDGRVVTGKTKEEFKFIFDSNEQGIASDVKTFDQVAEPVFIVLVVQVSNAMGEAIEEEKRGVRAIAAAAKDLPGSKVALISYASETKRL